MNLNEQDIVKNATTILSRHSPAESIFIDHILKCPEKYRQAKVQVVDYGQQWAVIVLVNHVLYLVGNSANLSLLDNISYIEDAKSVIGSWNIANAAWSQIKSRVSTLYFSKEFMFTKQLSYPKVDAKKRAWINSLPSLNKCVDLYLAYLEEMDLPRFGDTRSINSFLSKLISQKHLWSISKKGREEYMGMVFVNNTSDDSAHIAGLYISPEFRLNGFSKELMLAVESDLFLLGFRNISLNTGSSNKKAQGLYHSLGYRQGNDILFALGERK